MEQATRRQEEAQQVWQTELGQIFAQLRGEWGFAFASGSHAFPHSQQQQLNLQLEPEAEKAAFHSETEHKLILLRGVYLIISPP